MTALSALAASLGPGQWGTLTSLSQAVTNGLNDSFKTFPPASSGNGVAESTKFVWDPINRKVFHFGSDHNAECRFTAYDELTNTWANLTKVAWMPTQAGGDYNNGMMHGEDQTTIDPAAGVFYHRPWGTRVIEKYNASTGVWSESTAWPDPIQQDMVGMDYFPERRKIVIVDPAAGNATYYALREWSVDTGAWTKVSIGSFVPGDPFPDCGIGFGDNTTSCMRNFVRYNPVHGLVVFTIEGFSDRRMWKMNAAGTITRLNDAPFGLSIMCPCVTDDCIFVADPVSGDYLCFRMNEQFWTYNVLTDTWTQQSTAGFPSGFWTTAIDDEAIYSLGWCPISTYGVIMFIPFNHQAGKVLLYKHASGSAPVEAPRRTVMAVG